MTTFDRVVKKCPICNSMVQVTVLCSTNSFGTPDLDTRPAPMARDTMWLWIEKCENCGYVARDLNKIVRLEKKTIKELIETDEYKSSEGRSFESALATSFYKNYLIARRIGNHNEMLASLLHASWECDDSKDEKNAYEMRKLIIPVIDELQRKKDRPELDLMKADILRRMGMFGELIELYEEKTFDDELLNKIIRFQVQRAKAQDAARYTVHHVEKAAEQVAETAAD